MAPNKTLISVIAHYKEFVAVNNDPKTFDHVLFTEKKKPRTDLARVRISRKRTPNVNPRTNKAKSRRQAEQCTYTRGKKNKATNAPIRQRPAVWIGNSRGLCDSASFSLITPRDSRLLASARRKVQKATGFVSRVRVIEGRRIDASSRNETPLLRTSDPCTAGGKGFWEAGCYCVMCVASGYKVDKVSLLWYILKFMKLYILQI